jgi:Domain of unknown function (DUF6438)
MLRLAKSLIVLTLLPSLTCASRSVEFDSIRLSRTGCLGPCPVYSVEIGRDGSVQFTGETNVIAAGTHTSRLDASRVDRIDAAIRSARFSKLKSRTKGKSGCKEFRFDFPSMSIRVIKGGKERTVTFYSGCPTNDHTQRINELADALDEMANTLQWIKQ